MMCSRNSLRRQRTSRPRWQPERKIAVVGRPNVGKSTLVNRMLGEDRVVVYDQPGTTRDSVYINYEREGEAYTLIDTAGIRKRKHISEAVEKFSIVKTLKAIEDANVVILVMDGRESIVDQDLHLLGQVVDSGRAVVVGINKWDGLTADQKDKIKKNWIGVYSLSILPKFTLFLHFTAQVLVTFTSRSKRPMSQRLVSCRLGC